LRAALPVLAGLAALVFGGGVALSTHAEFEVAATLDWRQQVPRPAHPVRSAVGALSGDLDHQRRELHWKLVYRRLSGRATAAEIHRGKRGRTGPVLLRLCGRRVPKARRCRSGMSRTKILRAVTVLALESGNTYVELHTRRNPKGEIRGQVSIKG
jgi:hypothetical protein